MPKELLSDTDYTKGWDNRFGVTGTIGKVTKLEVSEKGANVRVIMPDRLDHQDQPLISKPIPVMQIASKAKRQFAVPRIGDNVLMVKLPNGTSNYMVIGSFYTSKDPPPVTDPNLDYVIYDDGSTMQFDASNGQLDWNLKGDYNFQGDKDFNVKPKGDVLAQPEGDVNVKPQGAVLIKPDGNIQLEAGTITLKGHVVIQGAMDQTGGVHTDPNGHHTSTARDVNELLARIEALERRVTALEQRGGQA